MRILHLSLDPVMWQPAQIHIQNLLAIEWGLGYETYCDLASADGLNVAQYGQCDIIHIHGWPIYENAAGFLNNFKQCLLSGAKIVVSMYNYAALCNRATMEDGNGKECDADKCPDEICVKIRSIRDIVQDVNVFVYSEAAKNIFTNYGFHHVHRMPICCFGNMKQFVPPSYNDATYNRVAIFDFGTDLPNEIEAIETLRHCHGSELKIYPINNVLHRPFEVNYSFIPMMWPCAMPTTIGLSLRTGAPVIVAGGGYGGEFDEVPGAVHTVDLARGGYEVTMEIIGRKQTQDERNDVAYAFWQNYGPDTSLAWYSSCYDYVLRNS